MKVKLTFAALALMAAGCSNQELTEAVQNGQDSNARVITLQATMPETADEAPATRVTYESDGATVSGIVMTWRNTDKLLLCFKYGGNYYRKEAAIVPSSISADRKQARFTIEIPASIPASAAFDFYAVYQQNRRNSGVSGCFEAGTPNYRFESGEEDNVTLDHTGSNPWNNGIINSVLLYSRTNVTQAELGTLKLDLAHTGWIMAVHLTNASGAKVDFPKYVRMKYPTASATSFIWNGCQGSYAVKMDVTTRIVSSYVPDWEDKAGIYFTVNEAGYPLYRGRLGIGSTRILYRWVVSTPQIEQMRATMMLPDGTSALSTNFLPARTVQNGKVYHVFLKWDGTDLTITKRDGTPY
ncbi:putative lipoprotein [Bacteroidetes bacterium oral taxon 272 str. F0290]|nr:putative lipoprotein [Bacteroidetes bacterium oral taxon 272 str. F0290]